MFSSLVLRLEAMPQRTLTVVHDWLLNVMADAGGGGDGFADDVREEILGGLEHFQRMSEASNHPQDSEIRAYLLGAITGAFPAPLHEAACAGCTRVARLLIARGTDVDSCGEDLVTPLYLAAKYAHVDVGRALIAANADVNFRGPGQRTALFAAISSKSTAFISMLIEAGAHVDGFARIAVQPHPGLCRITPLMFSILDGESDVARDLIDAGADVSAATPSMATTAAHFAAMCGNIKALRLLVARGADIAVADRIGNTPLHYLMRGILANTGVIVTVRSMTPLYIGVLRCLVAAGGPGILHARNAAGLTPLGLLTLLADGSAEEAARIPDFAPLIVELVTQGVYEWVKVPTPCPGLGRVLVPVWEAAPEELGSMFQRLHPELRPVARAALVVLHLRLGTAALVMRVLGVVMEQAEDEIAAVAEN